MIRALVALLLLGALAGAARANVQVERVGRGTTETAPTVRLEGRVYVGVNTLARLVGGTKYWRPDLRKLEIRNVKHTLGITVDAPWAIVDDVAIRLPGPARLYAGEVHVPIEIFPLALSGRFMPRAAYDERGSRLVLFDQEPNLGPPVLSVTGPRTRLTFPIATSLEPSVVSSRRSRFLVDIGGGVLSAVPGDSLPGQGLLSGVRFRREPGGVLLDLDLSSDARSYRVQVPTGQELIELEFAPEVPPGFVAFAPEYGAPPNRPLRVLVIDPGHGGPDSGYAPPGGPREKDLALALARQLRLHVAARLPGVQVVLTRDGDSDPPALQRVETANRVRGDLYLSLHFDGVPGVNARGVTATVAPPLGFDAETAFGGADDPRHPGASRPLALVPWRDAAGRYASDSRGVAELMLAAFSEAEGARTRLRTARVLPLEGANMPAVMLDCGTLSNPDERKRLSDPVTLSTRADLLARALERYAGGILAMNLVRALKRVMGFLGRATLLLVVVATVTAAVTIWWFRRQAARPSTVSAEVALPRGTRAIELYFPADNGSGLDLETREVVEDQAEGETLVRTVVGALLDGPDGKSLARTFPDGVTLQHVYRDPGGGLYLDFSPALRLGFRGGSTAEELLVQSLLKTLAANVPGVSRVTITSGGQPIVSLAGHIRLDGPLLVSEWR